ncbi:DUF1127 domain-containing protein [Parasulfitobacter algicola]|uniref:DUF1127 domain-containing protein n=1 Tax=Parasulfitobacter algicola TaxID=2614809 RepID=A0ABX2IW38_9RHOB|nr:DUF1127 domain-containing protein [Sulfitobacter algicola]NSX56510.1 DUF1127 domain-containing protein [Sulfitobacter algicola]
MATFALTGLRQKTAVISLKQIKNVLALQKSRRALAQLDDAALADIGLTRESALAEANRPIWDAPISWYK